MSPDLDTPAILVRDLRADDLPAVARIDALHTGGEKPDYWKRIIGEFLHGGGEEARFGLGAEMEGRLAGYIFGEVRSFEFGSQPCGWVFAVGVDPERSRHNIASSLLTEICRLFRGAGVECVRTMVRRDDVPVLSFFRSSGFVGGPFFQLELALPGEEEIQ